MDRELQRRSNLMDLPRVCFWEFVQNLPLVAGFLLGLQFWQSGWLWLALVSMIAGSLAGSVAIWLTESRIVEGHREPLPVVVANVVAITSLMVLLAAYLSAPWSRWWMDLLIGALGGAVLAAVQDLAARSAIGLGHCAALAVSAALALMGTRVLWAVLPLLINIVVVSVAVTVVIARLDYASLGVSELGEGNSR
jgi:hypothetical protein